MTENTEVSFGDDKQADLLRAAGYGIGSSGKTSLFTRVPEEWGTGLYIAADATSPSMKSVLPEDRKRIIKIVPSGYIARRRDQPNYKGPNPDEIFSSGWKEEAYDLAGRDWKRWLTERASTMESEKQDRLLTMIETLGWGLWDTLTQTADEMLRENAKKHYFLKDGGPTSGPKAPEIDFGRKWAQPDQGDYNMVQSECLELVERWNRQPFHTLMTFQEAVQTHEAAKHRDLLFGPRSVGQAGPRQLPNRFDINLYLTRERADGNPQGWIRAQLVQADNHVAGSKSTKVQEAIKAQFKLVDPEPKSARDFWRWLTDLSVG